MDAAPLVGTAASYGLMRDIIQEGLLMASVASLSTAYTKFPATPWTLK